MLADVVTVITFNLEYGAEGYGLERAASAIGSTGAKVALLQEVQTSGSATGSASRLAKDITAELAGLLGWYYLSFNRSATAIIAKLPVEKIQEGEHYGIGRVEGIYYCVIHLSDYPYIPFEASGIKYPEDCASRKDQSCFNSSDSTLLAERSAEKKRSELTDLRKALSALPPRSRVIAAGDFNEPSHLDWSETASLKGKVPMAIKFPATIMMQELGYTDTFRELHPAEEGYTWPDHAVPKPYREDRIDFIFVRGFSRIIRSQLIRTTLSDHAMVLAEVSGTQHGRVTSGSRP